jgi:predicted metal-binding protein
MTELETTVRKLDSYAAERGATSTRLISARDVAVAEWVRRKCQFGCRTYGKRFTCPPYAPSPSEMAEVLQGYQHGLLVEFANQRREELREEPKKSRGHRLLFEMERMAFLDGFYGAWALTAGPCNLCPECPAAKLENPTILDKKACLNPAQARPSMEACGVDVYETVRKAGYELSVVQDKSEPFTWFGLVLLD